MERGCFRINKAVFLDRDGTINVDKHFVYKPEDFEFIDGAPKAIRLLNDMGYVVIVVSNQSGIARGYYNYNDVRFLHNYIDGQLAGCGAKIDGYYICPHHPDFGGDCECRKPKTGLIEKAVFDFDIDIFASYMVGDKESDAQCAINAGIRPVLIRQNSNGLLYLSNHDILVFNSLLEFVNKVKS